MPHQIVGKVEKMDLVPLLLYFYPLTFFYTFLYYTDTVSLLFGLVSYWMVLKLSVSPSLVYQLLLLIVALLFVLMRQTNVVWLCFYVGTSMVKCLKLRKKLRYDDLYLPVFVSSKILAAIIGRVSPWL
jgi:hypothetical protein